MNDAREQVENARAQEKQRMDRSVDAAVDAAAGYLATYSDGSLQIDCEEVLEAFLGNWFSALGVLDRIPEQERLLEYLTCMIIVDTDGYFLWHRKRAEGAESEAFMWEDKVGFASENREKALEDAVLSAITEQEEQRGFIGKTYRLELPKEEGILKRGMGECGVFVMLRGMPEGNGRKVYEHFAFSGAILYKKKE